MIFWTLFCLTLFIQTVESHRNRRNRPWAYVITTLTCNDHWAGTDAKVYIKIIGHRDSTGWVRLNNPGDELNSNDYDTFFRRGRRDIGSIQRIEFSRDNSGPSPSWCKSLVKIMKAYMPQEVYLEYDQEKWLEVDSATAATKFRESVSEMEEGRLLADVIKAGFAESGNPDVVEAGHGHGHGHKNRRGKIQYIITTYTCDQQWAGTDATVYAKLTGSQGTTGWNVLSHPGDEFRRNRYDSFVVWDTDIGRITSIEFSHDDEGPSSHWCRSLVKVMQVLNPEEAYFNYGTHWTLGDASTKDLFLEAIANKDKE